MRSSRMRTARSLTVSWGDVYPGGGVCPGGVCPGVSAQGVSAWGVSCDLSHHAFDATSMLSLHQLRLIISAAAYIVFDHATEWQTCVKILPFCKLRFVITDRVLCHKIEADVSRSSTTGILVALHTSAASMFHLQTFGAWFSPSRRRKISASYLFWLDIIDNDKSLLAALRGNVNVSFNPSLYSIFTFEL